MIIFFINFSLMLLVVSFVVYFSTTKSILKYISIVLLFSILYSSWYFNQSVSGYAYEHPLPQTFQLIWGEEHVHSTIELWLYPAINSTTFSDQSRLYIVPWTQKLSDELHQAKKSIGKGIPTFMSKAGQENPRKGGLASKLKGSIQSLTSSLLGMNSIENLEIINNPTKPIEK